MSQLESDSWAYKNQGSRIHLSTENLENGFKRAARFYSALLKNRLELGNLSILDIPCGEGEITYWLQKHGCSRVRGFDLDASRIQSGTRLGLPLQVGDAFTVLRETSENSLGAVFSLNFLEHLEKNQVIEFMTLAFSRLVPGGALVVVTPSADSPFGCSHIFNDFTHKWAATSGVLRGLYTGIGFTQVEVFGNHPRWGMSYGWLRVPAFKMATLLVNAFCTIFGHRYSIWSASMWGVGIK